MRDGTERKSSSSSSPAPDCDVGLGLRLQPQPTESYGGGGGGGGASFFSGTSNQFAFMGEIYEAADRMFLPRGFHTTSLTASGGMGVCGKALFTNTQWQELERQKMVHKYIMASIPVPPQLLLPTSCTAATSPTTTTPVAAVTGQDLVRFPGNGSDPEPWRCKRTDGKKWRCSRDVAPNQKYCERHAHKSRPRSRKHVETPSHNNNYSSVHHHHQQRSTPLFPPTMASSTPSSSSSFDQTRCIEWFMRGGTTTHQEKNVSVLYEHGKQQAAAANTASFMSLNNNINTNTNINKNNDNNNNPYYPKLSSNKTRHFIDAWEKEGIFESPSSSSSSCKKFSPSSLSLSMSGDNNNNSSNYNDNINDHEKPQWMMSSNINHVSWMMNESCSSSPPPLPPGGPLGEALCLGGGSINAHHQGYYGNKSNANSSSCSKSSCEDGDLALNFIG
ncbi:hypothetical protein ABFS82_05G062600 [Erythranthe guttata]